MKCMVIMRMYSTNSSSSITLKIKTFLNLSSYIMTSVFNTFRTLPELPEPSPSPPLFDGNQNYTIHLHANALETNVENNKLNVVNHNPYPQFTIPLLSNITYKYTKYNLNQIKSFTNLPNSNLKHFWFKIFHISNNEIQIKNEAQYEIFQLTKSNTNHLNFRFTPNTQIKTEINICNMDLGHILN
eukprot:188994_1